ncbi:cell wall-binding repeat-containing protein [Herbiconiux sp. P16]|uniref:cell wall-binding repeat-containing protein n=1 Tax=Herbiconiux wuyangfengii TaxID=3342794 RepID=UPI0035BA77B9
MRFKRSATTTAGAILAVVLLSSVMVPSAQARPGVAQAEMLSVSDGSPQKSGDSNSNEPSMSSDGRYVVFSSSATNIGAVGTTAFHTQVYLRDVDAGTTTEVSSAGGVPGNEDSDRAVISGDGSTVAFVSEATNLARFATSGIPQVLVWSRATGELLDASVSNDIPNAANGRAIDVAISDTGKKVVFSSNATNLSAASTFGVFQIYSRDLTARVTALESLDVLKPGSAASSDVVHPAVSGDGRFVAFSTAANLTSMDSRGNEQIYVRDTTSGISEIASIDSSGRAGFGDSNAPSLSSDGHMVAFSSKAASLTPIYSTDRPQIYVRDLSTKSTQLVSIDVAGRSAANGGNGSPDIASDGSAVAFQSGATNLVPDTGALVPDDTNQIFVRALASGRTIAACRSAVGGGLCKGWSGVPSLSSDVTLVSFAADSPDLVPDIESRRTQVYLRDLTEIPRVDRIGGADRFEVSAATATDVFATGVPVAYVASGAGFADALSGSAAAGADRGPVVLVTKDSIPTLVGIALHRLKPQRIVVLGGTASIDVNVERALTAYAPLVTRIAGADRYEVSAQVSQAAFGRFGSVGGEHPPVYIASGATFPDALSGSAAAGSVGGPVLLVTKDGIPAPVMTELKRLAPTKIVVLGGRNTIADGVVTTLGTMAPTTRIDGADRFAVSASVSASSFAGGAHTVYVASGAVFPDALSGSAAAMQNRAPVLLVTADQIPATVATELDRLDPTRIVVLGGQSTVSDAVLKALEKYLKPV